MGLEWNYMLDLRPTWVNTTQAANWEASVRRHITWIAKTHSGRTVLSAIKFYGKWVPITHYDGKHGTCNAYVNQRAGRAPDGRPYGAMVYYSPHLFQRGAPCHNDHPGLNGSSLPDEILLHELVHAFRRVSGKRARVETDGGLINYDSNEEFIAILVTNIYVTDPTNRIKTALRRDHHGFATLEPELAGSFEFFEISLDAFQLVDRLCTDHPGLTKALAGVPAIFNPLAAYYQDKAKAARHSQSARAVVRDAAGWMIAAHKAISKWLP